MVFGVNEAVAANLVREVKKVATKPIIVKLSPNVTDIVAMAKAVEAAGADAISLINTLVGMRINLKTGQPIISVKKGGYSGPGIFPVALRMVYEVSHAVNIPVIGNGDVKNAEDAKKLFETANVDGIMIGRASLGNPWIFREIKEGLSEQKITRVTDKQRLDIILEHINLAVEQKGENIAIKEMRKHLAGYIKNMKEASKLREKINHIDTKQELDECLIEYFNNL